MKARKYGNGGGVKVTTGVRKDMKVVQARMQREADEKNRGKIPTSMATSASPTGRQSVYTGDTEYRAGMPTAKKPKKGPQYITAGEALGVQLKNALGGSFAKGGKVGEPLKMDASAKAAMGSSAVSKKKKPALREGSVSQARYGLKDDLIAAKKILGNAVRGSYSKGGKMKK